jgi:hypothetical protein
VVRPDSESEPESANLPVALVDYYRTLRPITSIDSAMPAPEARRALTRTRPCQ